MKVFWRGIFSSLTRFRASIVSNYLFVLPALIMFLTFNVYPFYKVFQMSFRDWNGIDPGGGTFIWLNNFKEALFYDSTWWESVRNAGTITLLALTLQNFLALVLAWIVDRGVRGAQFYRSVFFLPPILSGVVVGLVWNWIFRGEAGILNRCLTQIGLGGWTHAWFSDIRTALPALAVVHMWKGFGWAFIILLAGFQGIPRELYEAARVDGANEFSVFWRITVPLMVPVFTLVGVLTILGSMQLYDLVVVTTLGGPSGHTEVPMFTILRELTDNPRFGYASCLGVVFGFILVFVSIVQLQVAKRTKAE
jgi:ABC-type sugar transport system permease subunit